MDDTYEEAAWILMKVELKETSFRKLIFDSKNNKKLLYKLCFEAMKRRAQLDQILQGVPLLAENSIFADYHPPFIQHILLYEYLFGHGLKKCCYEWREPIERLSADLARLKNETTSGFATNPNLESGVQVGESKESNDAEASIKNSSIPIKMLPRYARVNTLKITVENAKEKLCQDGWRFIEMDCTSRKKYRQVVDNLVQYDFCIDLHIPELFVFTNGTDLHEEELVINGSLILQDKSSCLPTICLECKPGSHVIDMCAAPGVKTSHLAALLHNEGKIFAFDKNFDRFRLMEDMMSKTGVELAHLQCYDMLRLNLRDKQFQKVKYILLDPPCSGSGMVKRLDFLTDQGQNKDEVRLKKLANLQTMMLKHSLTLPSLKRLVYSTCSVHEEENEQVVQEVLNSFQESASNNNFGAASFKLIKAMPQWKHRGRRNYDFGKLCLRASAEKDRTNGFFVAVFERT